MSETTGLHLIYDDEQFAKVKDQWSTETLLAQPAVFFLKDICAKLEISTRCVIARASELETAGHNLYQIMGMRKVWGHWYVRMAVFAPYYRIHFQMHVQKVMSEWNANTLLAQKGLFPLSEVCKHIPFSTGQLRHQARKLNPAVCGIQKNSAGTYLVTMEIFGPWLSRLWQDGFHSTPLTSKRKNNNISQGGIAYESAFP